MGIVQDTSHWPLVFIQFSTEQLTDEAVERFFAEQWEMLARKERYVELVDASTVRYVMSAAQRRRFTEFLRDTAGDAERLCVGLTVVVPGALVRGAMQGMLWLFTPDIPLKTAGSLAVGARHCLAWLLENDLPDRERAERRLQELARGGPSAPTGGAART